jgi:hypothetical protein
MACDRARCTNHGDGTSLSSHGAIRDPRFIPPGDTAARPFRGNLTTATNRDLAAAMRDSPALLRELVSYTARRVGGLEPKGSPATSCGGSTGHLGSEYAWRGNYRDLEVRPSAHAGRLGLERRSVKARVDTQLLKRV